MITETIGNTRKVTSVLGGEGVSSGTRMAHYRESQKEAMMSTPLLTPKATTLFGTWNVRTMYEAGKCAQIAAEMTAYNLSILDLCETRWLESGCIQLSTGQTVLYSGHDSVNVPIQRELDSCLCRKLPRLS